MSLEEKFSEDGLAQQQEIEDLRAALVRTQRDLKKAKAKTDHLVEATIEAARDAVLSHPLPKTPRVAKSRSKAGSEVALWHLTDW